MSVVDGGCDYWYIVPRILPWICNKILDGHGLSELCRDWYGHHCGVNIKAQMIATKRLVFIPTSFPHQPLIDPWVLPLYLNHEYWICKRRMFSSVMLLLKSHGTWVGEWYYRRKGQSCKPKPSACFFLGREREFSEKYFDLSCPIMSEQIGSWGKASWDNETQVPEPPNQTIIVQTWMFWSSVPQLWELFWHKRKLGMVGRKKHNCQTHKSKIKEVFLARQSQSCPVRIILSIGGLTLTQW